MCKNREGRRVFETVIAALAVLFMYSCGMKSSLPVGEPEEEPLDTTGQAGAGGMTGEAGSSDEMDAGVDTFHCGNHIIEPELGEQCDGTDLGGASCLSLGEGPGRLRCGPACFFDVSMCEYAGPGGYGDGGTNDGGTNDGGTYDGGAYDGGQIPVL